MNSAWTVGPKVDFRKTTGIVCLNLKVTSMTCVWDNLCAVVCSFHFSKLEVSNEFSSATLCSRH